MEKYKEIIRSKFFSNGNVVAFIWNNDATWSVETVSKNIESIFGYKDSLFLEQKLEYSNLIHPDDLIEVKKEVVDAASRKLHSFNHKPYRVLNRDGKYLWVKDSTNILYDEEKNITHFVGYILSINDELEKIQEQKMELKKTLSLIESYKISMDESSIVSKSDISGKIIYANKNLSLISGYTIEELVGKNHNILRHPDNPKEFYKEMWETILNKKVWKGIFQNRGKTRDYWVDATIVPIIDEAHTIKEFIAVRHDVTEIIEHQKTIEKLINIDILTELPNRTKLHHDLQKSIKPSLVLINIDRFSQVNDFYGHEFGDKLLIEFSKKLQKEITEELEQRYTLYRYGGDEFAILVADYEEELTYKISQILQNLEKHFISINEKEIYLNLSCGISFENSSQALLSADMALKISKKEKKEYVVFSEENSLNKQYENNLLWAGKLKNALEENRVVPFFQPIVKNSNGSFEKYEALVRIIQEDGKVISPFFFLDIAKQTKQYLELTKIMVEKSFKIFENRSEEFSINLTMEDISNLAMREFLFEKFDNFPNIAKRVVLEIVESESIEDYDEVIGFISLVKSKGCKIAIDDFGSGYSNFEYLIKLQADYIKIDGSLIKNINTQRESFVVVSTIVSFAKEMGMKTIAEFIEDEAIFKTVQELGIDYSQGYYFSSPKRELIG